MLLSRTNFAMMSNIMLMFLLLLFLAGDVEKNPGPMGTPVSETNNKSLTIFHSNIRSLRNKINYISDIIYLEHSQVESMWFELKTKLSPILININHRPVKNGLCLIKDETGHKSHDLGNTQPAS
jgi:hypothetical protein